MEIFILIISSIKFNRLEEASFGQTHEKIMGGSKNKNALC